MLYFFIASNLLNAQQAEQIKNASNSLFDLYLNKEIDSLINNYLPNEKMWSLIKTDSVIKLNDYEISINRISNWLNEEINGNEELNEKLTVFIIDSIKTSINTSHLIISSNKYDINECLVYFSSGANKFKGTVITFFYDNRFWLHPISGIQYTME